MKSIFNKKAGVIIGLVVIAVTLMIYFLGNISQPKALIDVLAFLYILLSEIIFFGSVFVLNYSKETQDRGFIKSGIFITLFLYWLATTIFSLAARDFYYDNIGPFSTINIIIMVLAAIVCIIIFVIYTKIRDSSIKTLNAVETLKNCENMVLLLRDNSNYSKYEEALNKLYEDIKYCNNAVMAESDIVLVDKLLNLEKKLGNGENIGDNVIYALIEDIRFIIKKRNLESGQQMQGGI